MKKTIVLFIISLLLGFGFSRIIFLRENSTQQFSCVNETCLSASSQVTEKGFPFIEQKTEFANGVTSEETNSTDVAYPVKTAGNIIFWSTICFGILLIAFRKIRIRK